MEQIQITMLPGNLDRFCLDFNLSRNQMVGFAQAKDTGLYTFTAPLSKACLGLVPDFGHLEEPFGHLEEPVSRSGNGTDPSPWLIAWKNGLGYTTPITQIDWDLDADILVGEFVELAHFEPDLLGATKARDRINRKRKSEAHEEVLSFVGTDQGLFLYLKIQITTDQFLPAFQDARMEQLKQQYGIISVV